MYTTFPPLSKEKIKCQAEEARARVKQETSSWIMLYVLFVLHKASTGMDMRGAQVASPFICRLPAGGSMWHNDENSWIGMRLSLLLGYGTRTIDVCHPGCFQVRFPSVIPSLTVLAGRLVPLEMANVLGSSAWTFA